jgi:nucleotide-binding universal stress UspA family protein
MVLKSILVAYDGTQPAVAALDQAVEIAERHAAKMTLACVIPIIAAAYGVEMPPGTSVSETIDAARQMLATAKAEIAKKGVSSVDTVLLEGDPVDQILEFAKKHPPDLIVVGSRGLSDAGRFFLGSVSDGILHHAHSSVLVVKSAKPEATSRRSRAM